MSARSLKRAAQPAQTGRRANKKGEGLTGNKPGKSWKAWLVRALVAPTDVAEKELWPELIWLMAALLRAGYTPAQTFSALTKHYRQQGEIFGEKTSRRWARKKASTLALEDIVQLCQATAQATACGKRPSNTLKNLNLNREYSTQRARELAACWAISEHTGAGIAGILENLAKHCENEIDADLARESAMSAPKTTGTILSWLPVLGLGMGMLMGTKPLTFLLGSIPGALIALLGLGLTLAGKRWTSSLLHRAERSEL